jgi:hypothetical protein
MADTGAWITVFRSSNPAHWGVVDRKAADHFALDLRKVPEGIRYLKLTDTSSKDFVIIEMKKESLMALDFDSAHGWRGDAVSQNKGTHLGICDRQSKVRTGDVSLTVGWPQACRTGWGFGHRFGTNDRQAYVWAGRQLPVTVFEIAVRTGEPSAAEKAKLLSR